MSVRLPPTVTKPPSFRSVLIPAPHPLLGTVVSIPIDSVAWFVMSPPRIRGPEPKPPPVEMVPPFVSGETEQRMPVLPGLPLSTSISPFAPMSLADPAPPARVRLASCSTGSGIPEVALPCTRILCVPLEPPRCSSFAFAVPFPPLASVGTRSIW